MQTRNQTQARSRLSVFGSHFLYFVSEQFVEVSTRVRKIRDARHLKELPDYLLHDVGVERSEIDPVVDRGVSARQR